MMDWNVCRRAPNDLFDLSALEPTAAPAFFVPPGDWRELFCCLGRCAPRETFDAGNLKDHGVT